MGEWGRAMGGGGLVDPCKAWVPPPSILYIKINLVMQKVLLHGIALGQAIS